MKIGETVLTNAPYSVVVTNVGVGTYAVAVLVTDEIGITNITTVTYRVSEIAVANDNFADRAVLTGESIRVTAPIEGATMEQGEPSLSQYGGAQRKTIWWRWVAPSSGYYDFATTAAEIEVFKGNQISSLQAVTIPNQTGVSAAIPYYQTRYKRAMVQAGEEYAIRVAPRSVYNAPAPDATIGINRYPSLAIDGPPDSGEFSVKPLAAPRQISCVYFLSPYPYDVFHPEVFDGAYSPTPICAPPFTTSVGLRPGNYNWYVMAVDELGLQARSELRQFVVKDPTLVNDDFANRIALEGTKFRLAPTTLSSATLEPAEIFQPNTGSLWWSWTCPVSARYGIKVSGPHILKFGVYTGSTLTALAKVVESSGSETNFAAVAGVTYNFQMVASHDTGGGIPPAQADEVRIARLPVVAIISPQPNSQFPRGGNLRMDVEVTSPDSPVTSVDFFEVRYIGNSPDLVQRGTVTIPPYHLTFTNLPAGSPRTLVAIAHDDFGMSGQSSGLVFSVPTYPVNDHFNQRVRLSGALAEGAASSIGATLEAGEPDSSSTETLWWTWTAPETRAYQLKLLGDFASRLDVFTGDTLATLVSVGGVTNEYPTRIDRDLSIQANAGAVYQIRVSPYPPSTPESGPLTFQIRAEGQEPRPMVTIVTPQNEQNSTTGSKLAITAVASADYPLLDSGFLDDGYVSMVEFFANDQSLGKVFSESRDASTFSVIWTNRETGRVLLTAKASDQTGVTTTSAPVAINVSRPQQIELRLVEIQPGKVQFSIVGPTDYTYSVRTSTDLINWTTVATNLTSSSAVADYLQYNAGYGRAGFYQAVAEP